MKRFNMFCSLQFQTSSSSVAAQICRLTPVRRAPHPALAGEQPEPRAGLDATPGVLAKAARPSPPDAGRPAAEAERSAGPDRRRVLTHSAAGGHCKNHCRKRQFWSGIRTRDRPLFRRLLYPIELSQGGVPGIEPGRATRHPAIAFPQRRHTAEQPENSWLHRTGGGRTP